MASNYGIKILKPDVDSTLDDPLTEQNKKDFIILNTVDTDKILKAFNTSAIEYEHGLGYVPLVYAFAFNDDSYGLVSFTVTKTKVIFQSATERYLMIFSTRLI
jgi:hypothetical protein